MKTLSLLLILTLLSFCNRQSERVTGTSPENDRLCSAIVPLPDTSFSSVEALIYNITIFDTINSGVLENLRDMYDSVPGILTFRGGPYRDFPKHGKVAGRPESISVDWTFKTAFDTTKTPYGIWGGGTGWTGQPLLADWPDDLTGNSTTNKEIIVASLAGELYFLDYSTGHLRNTIDVFNVIKGTPSLDRHSTVIFMWDRGRDQSSFRQW